jgi:hypothetical protein
MNFTRSNEEYIIIGKITEAKEKLLALNQELVELESNRLFSSTGKGFSFDIENEVTEVLCDDVPEPRPSDFADADADADAEADAPIDTAAPLIVDTAPLIVETAPLNVERKPIALNQTLILVGNDEQLAAEISAGKNTNVRWGAQTYVSSWSKGKKYDPKNARVSLLRKELRAGRRTIRELSGATGLAINTIKDIIREMDKQGFFVHK